MIRESIKILIDSEVNWQTLVVSKYKTPYTLGE